MAYIGAYITRKRGFRSLPVGASYFLWRRIGNALACIMQSASRGEIFRHRLCVLCDGLFPLQEIMRRLWRVYSKSMSMYVTTAHHHHGISVIMAGVLCGIVT